MGVFFHHAQKQAFKFENRWRVKKSSPESGDVSDHSPQLTTMPNWQGSKLKGARVPVAP